MATEARKKGRAHFPRTGFGAILRRLRREAGLSQEALARKVDCSVGTLSRLELGGREPYWPLVLLLADALGVGPNDFRNSV